MNNVSRVGAECLVNKNTASADSGRGPRAPRGGCLDTAGGGPLGNATEKQSPPLKFISYADKETGETARKGCLSDWELKVHSRRVAYSLQVEASKILYSYHGDKAPVNSKGYAVHHRTCTCERFSMGGDVQLKKSVKHKKVMAANVMRCANAKTCPVCAKPIAERKANEMRLAANMAPALSLNFSMLTLTIPHCLSDKIGDLAPLISKASTYFWSGKVMNKIRQNYGIKGNIRSFEVRYGQNGWHPHFHFIVVSSNPLPTTSIKEYKKSDKTKRRVVLPLSEQHEDWQRILRLWQNACSRAGLGLPNENGLDIQNGKNAGEYITKFGSNDELLVTSKGKKVTWDLMDEMTKGHMKQGRKNSLSPWDLLSISSGEPLDGWEHMEPSEAKKLFLFYSRGTEKIHTLRWSRGLRSIFGLSDKDLSDSEILAKQEDSALYLCSITSKEWRSIVKKNHQTVVYELAENGGIEAIANYLNVPLQELMSRQFVSEKTDVEKEILAFDRLNHTKTRRDLSKKEKFAKSLLPKTQESDLDSDDYYTQRELQFYTSEQNRLEEWFQKE